MSGEDVVVLAVDKVVAKGNIAFSDLYSNKISLNKDVIDISTAEDIVVATGINYHELCHVLYTPPNMVQNLSSKDFTPFAFNILEDQRIEGIFSDRYPVVAKYFTKAVIRYIRDEGDDDEFMLYLLTYGRRYLPESLRDATCQVSTAEDVAFVEEIKPIVDKYVALDLSLPMDTIVAKRLVDELVAVLEAKYGGTGVKQTCLTKTTSPDSKGSSGAKEESLGEELRAVLDEIDVQITPELLSEALDQQRSISSNKHAAGILKDGMLRQPVVKPVDSLWQVAARRMSEEFSRLYADQEPYWQTHESYGRLNTRRAASGGKQHELFDEWMDEQEVDTSLEVVVLVDHSSSMDKQMDMASMSLWALKKAVEHNEGTVTAIGFNTSAFPLYTENILSNEYNSYKADGATYPFTALQAAHTVLASSSLANKVLVVITDGAWCNCHNSSGMAGSNPYFRSIECPKLRCEDMIRRIGLGATTALFFLSSKRITSPDSHCCQFVDKTNTVEELHDSVRNLVADMIRGGGR